MGTSGALQVVPLADKASLFWVGLNLLIFTFSYLPAKAPVFWFLRVGVPEIGWVLWLTTVPASIWLARKSPYTSLGLAIPLLLMMLWPWFQAFAVKRSLPQGVSNAFGDYRPDRDPLSLGATVPVEMLTEEYKPGYHWDRYQPVNGKVRARILFVHGGSWRNGTRGDYPQMFRYLAGRGYQLYSITYRLAPEHPYPAAPDDVASAIEQLSGDELPLILAGRSSGGHLALLGAYTHSDQVQGVVGIYPPVDMVWSYQNPSNPAVLNSREALEQFLGGTPEQIPEIYRQASPIHQVEETTPPTLLIHGDQDCLVYLKQSQMLSQALADASVPHYLLRLPWTEHGGDITVHGPTGRLSCWAIEAFLNSLVSQSKP